MITLMIRRDDRQLRCGPRAAHRTHPRLLPPASLWLLRPSLSETRGGIPGRPTT